MKITFIYTLEDENGNVRYIGKTSDTKYRLRKHLSESKKKRTHKEKWINSLGGKLFLKVLDEVPEDEWSYWECYWINQFKQWGFNLVNGTSGGEGSDGFRGKKHTQETKEKCRQSAYKSKVTKVLGSDNGRSKLSEGNVRDIRVHLDKGVSQRKIASKFNVSKTVIYRIKHGIYWSHVK